jgi:hypothetical protein
VNWKRSCTPVTPGRSASAAVALGATLLLAACGSSLKSGSVHLAVHQRYAPNAPIPIEGSIGYVRVKGTGGESGGRKLEKDRAHLTFPPGRYTLSSWQRPCSANCDHLEGATERCSRSFDAHAHDRLRAGIVLRPPSGCRIALTG